jgi:hypothetical protein
VATKKPKLRAPTSAAVAKTRRIAQLAKAWAAPRRTPSVSHEILAVQTYAELHAVVFAVFPGRQRAKNAGELLDQGTRAVCRVIRRRSRKRVR